MGSVKSATGDLGRMREDRRLAGESLAIMSGDDDLTLAMMADPAISAAGVISVMSNLAPGALSRMVKAQAEGETDQAQGISEALSPLLKLVGCSVTSVRDIPGVGEVEVTDTFELDQ